MQETHPAKRLAPRIYCGALEYVTRTLALGGFEYCNDAEECDEIGLLICAQWPRYVQGQELYIIGPNGTTLSSMAFETVSWTTPAKATRALLSRVFNLEVLTKSFRPEGGRFGKKRLDPLKIDDIVHCVLVEVKGASVEAVRGVIANVWAEATQRDRRNRK